MLKNFKNVKSYSSITILKGFLPFTSLAVSKGLSFSAVILKDGIAVYKPPKPLDRWHTVPKNTINPDDKNFGKNIDKFILSYLLKKNHNLDIPFN